MSIVTKLDSTKHIRNLSALQSAIQRINPGLVLKFDCPTYRGFGSEQGQDATHVISYTDELRQDLTARYYRPPHEVGLIATDQPGEFALAADFFLEGYGMCSILGENLDTLVQEYQVENMRQTCELLGDAYE